MSSDDTIEPWKPEHHKPIPKERLAVMREALQNPMAASEGHKKSLRGMRELLDEVERLRRVAATGWRTALHLAIACNAHRSEEAADKALKEFE